MSRRRPRPRLVQAAAPCRVDCGGTLDIGPLSLGLNAAAPATLNLALDLPTTVTAEAVGGTVNQVESAGFEPALAPAGEADYTHPLGFFFLALDYFGLQGVKLSIASASPPRAALGGSSAAILGATAALARLAGRRLARREAAALAFQLEQALFPTPCGRQDHLAAAYGGVHLWTWTPGRRFGYKGRKLLKGSAYPRLEARLLVAYPGQEHASAEVNRTWTQGFLSGASRAVWREISAATKNLARSIEAGRWAEAARWLQAETRLRLALTPEVLPPVALSLVQAAEELGAGARFCGAGGGGCVWALGPQTRIDQLRPVWGELVAAVPQARLLPVRLDRLGLRLWAKGQEDQPG